jgi:2-C-methyl-D-erythritol 2,4-cyclodiphosphate synthase
VASGELLAEARRRASEAGLTPLWIDLTVTAKAPRLAERLVAMGASIAAALGLSAEVVSVKASTGNLIGDEGAGRAIRCQVILLAEHVPD